MILLRKLRATGRKSILSVKNSLKLAIAKGDYWEPQLTTKQPVIVFLVPGRN